jgi:hypothetical protein
MASGLSWTADAWKLFNGDPNNLQQQPGLLRTTMGPMQVAQQVFNVTVTGSDNPIPADTIDFESGMPTTGLTRGFATLLKPFSLFPVHVNDPTLSMATNQVNVAAQALALAEDSAFFQGRDAQLPHKGKNANHLYTRDKEKLDRGLLGIAEAHKVIRVLPGRERRYGLATYSAVIEGLAHFTTQQQGPPYALILSPDVFADANLPLKDDALATPANAIQALLTLPPQNGFFVMSPGLPHRTGLFASKNTTTLYVGTGPLVEFNTYEDSVYSFTARESIQFLTPDARSLIKLVFEEAKQ